MTKHGQILPEHSRTVPRKRTDKADAAFDQAQPLDPRAIMQRAALAPQSLRPADILRLQQTIGNRAVARLLSQLSPARSLIQAKLTVNAPGDKYELEADRMADQVMRTPAVQGQEVEAVEKLEVMTKREPAQMAGGAFEAGEDFEQQLRASRGQGQPLPPTLREEFETKFDADFSGVRVHADAPADQLNQSIQAQAFTTGQDVFFRQGAYEPGGRQGRELIAHELAHVLQQGGASAEGNRGAAGPLIQRASIEGREVKDLKELTAFLEKKELYTFYENAWLELDNEHRQNSYTWNALVKWCESSESLQNWTNVNDFVKTIELWWESGGKKASQPQAEPAKNRTIEVYGHKVDLQFWKNFEVLGNDRFKRRIARLILAELENWGPQNFPPEVLKYAERVVRNAGLERAEPQKELERSEGRVELYLGAKVSEKATSDKPGTKVDMLSKYVFHMALEEMILRAVKGDKTARALLNKLAFHTEGVAAALHPLRYVSAPKLRDAFTGKMAAGMANFGDVLIASGMDVPGLSWETHQEGHTAQVREYIDAVGETIMHELMHFVLYKMFDNESRPWKVEKYAEMAQKEDTMKLLIEEFNQGPREEKNLLVIGAWEAVRNQLMLYTGDKRINELPSHVVELYILWGSDARLMEKSFPKCWELVQNVLRGEDISWDRLGSIPS
jgi:hypothetical protein